MQGHKDRVHFARWLADSKTLVTCSRDKEVILWNVITGEIQQTLSGHDQPIYAIDLSPDNTQLASADDGGEVIIWNLADGQSQARLEAKTGVRSIAWSRDGTILAIGGKDGQIQLWSTDTWEQSESWSGRGGWVNSLAWSPAEWPLASGGSGAHLWKQRPYELARSLQQAAIAANCVAWSPDGTILASANGDGTLRLWNARNGRCLATLLVVDGSHGVIIDSWGNYCGPETAMDQLVFVAKTDDGQQTFRQAEFASRFGWQNQPPTLALPTTP